MGDKIREFLANHFEKLLLPLFGIAIIWLVLTKVIIGPNRVQMGGETYEPWGIDRNIARQAEDLKLELAADAMAKAPPVSQSGKLEELLKGSSLQPSAQTQYAKLDVPKVIQSSDFVGRQYTVPQVGVIDSVAVAHMRAAAYLPTEPVTADLQYGSVAVEPNDIDFVTLQGTFDVPALVKRFDTAFAGSAVKLEWRDPQLAKPVFGDVRVERRTMTAEGAWGPWTIIPRSQVDHRKGLFPVADRVDQLETGGLKVKMIQFSDMLVQADVLQPPVYDIASAREAWYPPTLYARYTKIRDEEIQQLIQEEREREIEERQRLRDRQRGAGDSMYGGADAMYGGGSRTSRTSTRTGTGRTGTGRTGTGRTGTGRTGTSTTRVDPRYPTGAVRQGSAFDLDRELRELRIPTRTEVTDLKQPVVFWAIDDTVEPGQTYQYRMKLGVFNPIAGTNNFLDKNAPEKDQTLLWSQYTDVIGPIHVPQRVYLFAKDVQASAKIIGVDVAKFQMGYWRNGSFSVRCGETIGAVVEQAQPEKPRPAAGGYYEDEYADYAGYGGPIQPLDDPTRPDEIDFRTGAVVVDVASVDDWTTGRNMRQVQYFEMLYSFDGRAILHAPIGQTYWPRELQVARADIQRALTTPIEPLRTRGGGTRTTTPVDVGMYEEMYMQEYGDLYQQ